MGLEKPEGEQTGRRTTSLIQRPIEPDAGQYGSFGAHLLQRGREVARPELAESERPAARCGLELFNAAKDLGDTLHPGPPWIEYDPTLA